MKHYLAAFLLVPALAAFGATSADPSDRHAVAGVHYSARLLTSVDLLPGQPPKHVTVELGGVDVPVRADVSMDDQRNVVVSISEIGGHSVVAEGFRSAVSNTRWKADCVSALWSGECRAIGLPLFTNIEVVVKSEAGSS